MHRPAPSEKFLRHYKIQNTSEECALTYAGDLVDAPYVFGPGEISVSTSLNLLSYCSIEIKFNACRAAEKDELTMTPSVCVYWDVAYFALKPIEISNGQRSMKVQSFWLTNARRPEEFMATFPAIPGNLATPGRRKVRPYDCETREYILELSYSATIGTSRNIPSTITSFSNREVITVTCGGIFIITITTT